MDLSNRETKHSGKQDSPHGLVEVTFDLEDQDLPYVTETVWAEPLGKDLYRLRNVPYIIRGFSEQDIVTAVDDDGRLKVTGRATSGGHSAYRIYLQEDSTRVDFASAWVPLKSLGCTYERATDRVIAVDVPPEADMFAVYGLLQEGERSGKWNFEEGHCAHPLRE